jgi:DNA methyltransferase 1-associated protein 1
VERSVEEIKDRYYSVSKVLLEARGQKDHIIVQKPFNYTKEKTRKENLEKLFMRTKEDNEDERTLIADLKKLD